jgi:hypothetical protein
MECDKQTSLPQKITVPGTDRTQKVTDKCFTLKNRFKKAERTSSSGLIKKSLHLRELLRENVYSRLKITDEDTSPSET